MSVTAAEPCQQRSHQAAESHKGITTEGAEEQVEPNDVGLQTLDRRHQTKRACWIIERPATLDCKPIQFMVVTRQLVA